MCVTLGSSKFNLLHCKCKTSQAWHRSRIPLLLGCCGTHAAATAAGNPKGPGSQPASPARRRVSTQSPLPPHHLKHPTPPLAHTGTQSLLLATKEHPPPMPPPAENPAAPAGSHHATTKQQQRLQNSLPYPCPCPAPPCPLGVTSSMPQAAPGGATQARAGQGRAAGQTPLGRGPAASSRARAGPV